ncbi:hypothetical protein RISK_006064 [Rhodopirellula islandica]|uniref:Uncharacterized protein n=1 Tax=Rhodopirellula islandica TaxID=595434 RepID=A0A0J1B502_RHOIS|nr:hypothetical protein RISK_006064 [Rhodopirellula islandica]
MPEPLPESSGVEIAGNGHKERVVGAIRRPESVFPNGFGHWRSNEATNAFRWRIIQAGGFRCKMPRIPRFEERR